MKSIINPTIQKISEISDKKEMAKFIAHLIKNNESVELINTAFNKFFTLTK